MTTSNGGCGCGGPEQQTASVGTAIRESGKAQAAGIKPGLIDPKVTLLISAGAAMAGACEPCLRTIVPKLKEAGASDAEIQGAIFTGQMVKERPMQIMKEVADELTGTSLSEPGESDECPAESMVKDDKYRVTMLIAAGAAMAANCEFCLNRVIPDLIEVGVSETDMRRAVEIGQFIKDKPAAIMKEAADTLTGSNLLKEAAPAGASSPGEAKQGGGGCG